jgi:hypothetical protein
LADPRTARDSTVNISINFILQNLHVHTWVAITSARDTLFLSPPDTPRMNSLPTSVFFVWPMPRESSILFRMSWTKSPFFPTCSGLSRGILFWRANFMVSLTVRVGKWMSSNKLVSNIQVLNSDKASEPSVLKTICCRNFLA